MSFYIPCSTFSYKNLYFKRDLAIQVLAPVIFSCLKAPLDLERLPIDLKAPYTHSSADATLGVFPTYISPVIEVPT